MSRTVSARIPKELHEELRERCNKLGCNISDYILEGIAFILHNHSEFDFGDENETKPSVNQVTDRDNVKKVVIQA